ncbi:cold-shock protein [Larkinella arboricola]|uniref:CspA family cold shock protein n=1 Tax=Larkinella arboricola TaxID=643671 RepID=A0A327WVB4_LARAB|nr:cold-shock protein [Larkinella arboricola]RAJ93050.1 CspA family cold shock protein [Larkinella arboricola]
MATGTVKFFNRKKGFGFIVPSDLSPDLFVHISDCLDSLVEQDKVTYEVELGLKGLYAKNVKQIRDPMSAAS